MEVLAQTLRKFPRQRVLLEFAAPAVSPMALYTTRAGFKISPYVTALLKQPRNFDALLASIETPTTVIVPNVVGQLLNQAILLLGSAGLSASPIVFVPSLTIPINIVISQSPVGGTVLPFFGTPVSLTVSSGPPVLNPVWVRAMSQGYYNGHYREIGDVFELLSISDLSNYNADIDPDTADSPVRGWMLQLPGSPMPIEGYQSLVMKGAQAPRRTVL